LYGHEAIVGLIAGATGGTGLKIEAEPDVDASSKVSD